MPNLPAHMALAEEVARHLGHPLLERHKGSLLLGSTAPDIRALTRWERDETHFAPLDSADPWAGVHGLFQANPSLGNPHHLSHPTLAFLAGYISHLVADQLWVLALYRPFFGNPGVYPDPTAGKVMDRALQLALDAEVAEWVRQARPLLVGAEEGVAVGFIDPATLRQWREWVEEFCGRGFSWDRLLSLASRRQEPADRAHARRLAEEFLRSVERGLEQLYRKVPPQEVEGYKRAAVEESARAIREFLLCAELPV